jgi:SH3 domain-containing protein
MSYIECTQCGHKALSVASRCPHCGFEFPPRPLHRPMPEPRHDRRRASLVLGGALVAGVVVVAALLHRSGSRPADAGPVTAPADTAVSGATGIAGPDTGSAALATDSARPAAPAPRPAVAPARAGVTRYARTWINVREGRARATRSVRVLTPGEAVLVDSLRRGWYRVLADGRTLGYVHRSNLDAVPPTARP